MLKAQISGIICHCKYNFQTFPRKKDAFLQVLLALSDFFVDPLIMQLSNHLTFNDISNLLSAFCIQKKFFKRHNDGFKYYATQPSLSQLIITFILFIFIVLQINRLV